MLLALLDLYGLFDIVVEGTVGSPLLGFFGVDIGVFLTDLSAFLEVGESALLGRGSLHFG